MIQNTISTPSSIAGFNHDPSQARALLAAHWSLQPTPLHSLPEIANRLGFKMVRLKDETNRMGLGSFKALGGQTAVAELARSRLRGDLTVACASAGNHGLSVASAAQKLGIRAVIYIAETVPQVFAQKLRCLGADVVRTGHVYEDAMAKAAEDSEANGWELVSDSSWEGYRDIPSNVMRGYCIMADEMRDDFREKTELPTHIALQAGVGGMAAALAARIRATWDVQPELLIVEPEHAPCLARSHAAGHVKSVGGPVSNMGRLDCKEPSLIAHEIFAELTSDPRAPTRFVQISDKEAETAAKLLASCGINTTPSGAAGVAGLAAAHLPADAKVLAIVTEGAEDV